jgi:CDP-glycerol glycerophosphotransferase
MRAERAPGLRRLPPLMRRVQPDVVLYNAWWGKLADNPKAIFEELRRRDAALEHVWVLDDLAAAPEGASVVEPGSLGFLAQTGRARYIVSNNTLRRYFRKKPSTTYVQTWHGAVLKRIGLDIERPAWSDSARDLRALRREVASWDYLVSPNRFSTGVMRGAFGYEGEVLEMGYPRNDLLFAADRDEVRAGVRARLGVPEEARAVLYAPTWRDDAAFSTALDLAGLGAALGDGYVLLVRAHSAVAATLSLRDGPGVRNVSDVDDVGELLLAADVLVTDYSSVMFDFAPLRKPMLFFTYDLERYRDELRGFYFDFEAEVPGPLLATTPDLADALRDVDTVGARYAQAHERFVERYCDLDDGRAAARVVDAVFGV